ncbi:MAG: hypothetical protein A3K19_07495 [Lentisphaerae bacterium RIFOXYB12_FULL_65_16]|nr:MAG: hypothetical protein A3K18_21700 [Lentisphaerae bacterium RIFOXYA12_64_32]OGV93384.1 MAG: hypothetical protein A3K19_07495 [Lentisphaerae bacterium RIFOXYB12_FULL_65_16]
MNETPGKSPQASVILVDDTPANLQVLSGMLRDCGYKPRSFPNGRLALQAAAKEPPDLILLDILMPEMDGYETCRRLKEDERLRSVPVIFISALSETLDKVKAFQCGGVDYITKPFQFEEVEARVRTHVAIKRLQAELAGQYRSLQMSYEDLRRLEALRDNLTRMVVHDMRGPLMVMQGYLQMLQVKLKDRIDEKERGFFAETSVSCNGLVEMVSSLLEVSRLEEGKMPLRLAESDLRDLAAKAVRTYEPMLRRCALAVSAPPGSVTVICDPDLIERVFANLVGNAVKFTPPEGSVEVRFRPAEGEVRVEVVDTGPGVPHEYHAKIFEKFGQVEARREGRKYSTGLGLTFCKLAVETHGGAIGVDSDAGKGSTFWFVLPRTANPQAR